MAAELIAVIRLLRMEELREVDLEEIKQAVNKWAIEQRGNPRAKTYGASASYFAQVAKRWLRYHGHLKTQSPPPQPLSGEGRPAVVFEAGGHSSGYTWINIQPDIAKLTQACWYDRAGLGWSDPGPSPRTFIAIAKELHALLHAAAVPPPYLLVAGGGLGDDLVRR
jgi:pimeloyl-ACP methyl ester carboxylesterase